MRPEHVITEEQRQIKDYPDHGGGDGRQRRGELQFVVGGFHQRPAGEDEQERGQEGKPGDEAGCYSAGKECLFWPEDLMHIGTNEAHEGHHHDQRPWGGLAQRQAIDHLGGGQPAVMAYRALIDIRQYRIGAAEGE